MSLVVDASAVVALLVDGGGDGTWVARTVDGHALAAPHLMPTEAANILRRHELAGEVTSDQAAQAHTDLVDLDVDLWPYDLLASRAWSLRPTLTIYDASNVALAEVLGLTLVTLDRRIARAPGLRCAVLTPPTRRKR